MKLHSKQIGSVGALSVAADLAEQGYYVFTELGDICKTDVIVMGEDYDPVKVQVKTTTSVKGRVFLSSKKAGPGYRFRYQMHHADVYALYVRDLKLCLYVSNTELLKRRSTLTIRVAATKNNQASGVNFGAGYQTFERALRDCTRRTLAKKRG